MSANIVDHATIENEDRIGLGERRQAVRDDDQRAAVRDPGDIRVDDRLALRIERAGRFVEDQDRWIDDQRARDARDAGAGHRRDWWIPRRR